MRTLVLVGLVFAAAVQATELFDRNLAYSSPFKGFREVPIARGHSSRYSHADLGFLQFAHDTREIQARHIAFVKRSTVDGDKFQDEHYPTFYGSDFSNVPPVPCFFREEH